MKRIINLQIRQKKNVKKLQFYQTVRFPVIIYLNL